MLKGKSINLRMVRRDDLETLYQLDSDVYARGSYFPLDLRSEVTLRARYDKDGMWGSDSGSLLIVDPVDDRIIGNIVQFKGVHYYDGVEIGYLIFRPEDRGKGFTTEAVNLFTKYLFDSMKISRIQIQVELGNLASRKVAEKCGFQFEGIARSAVMSHGVSSDIAVLSLVRSDLTK